MTEKIHLKPIVKWAGGKRNIMEQILSQFPKEFNDYHEPFLGGGSVVMELSNRGLLHGKHVYIADLMLPLMNVYKVIKEDVQGLINELKGDSYKNDKDAFIQKRARFNDLKQTLKYTEKDIECAALFLYLNRTCFNGMYRENSKGGYNVPYGKQTNPLICNEELLQKLSMWLNSDTVHIDCGSYEVRSIGMKKGDFVYLDPPYYGTFTDYNKDSFDKSSQVQLRDFVKTLSERGVLVAVSNSNCEFIREIYSEVQNVKFIEIPVKRVINSKGADRKNETTELLILNYDPAQN